jgi:hypothetical protein
MSSNFLSQVKCSITYAIASGQHRKLVVFARIKCQNLLIEILLLSNLDKNLQKKTRNSGKTIPPN